MAASTLYALIGTLVGALLGGFEWAIAGFAVGFGIGRLDGALSRVRGLESTVAHLESALARLEARVRTLEAIPPAGAEVARPAERPTAAPTAAAAVVPPPVTPPPVPLPAREAASRAAGEPADTPKPRSAALGPPPVQPARDDVAAGVLRPIIGFFTTGNVVAKVGIVILFFGAAFLVRYAADRGLLPIEYRLMALVAGALALQGVGWRLRHTRRTYAMALQGGASGLLYLTIFAAFRLYSLLPASLTFALLLAVVVFSAVLAVVQDEKSLAVLGSAGGFLTPILASTGAGDHVGLFSYYLLLNAGIVGIAWFRAWRILNWIGFIFTFGVGFLWGAQFYEPALFRTTEPFLVLFFVFYLSVAVLFALRQPPQLRGYLDGSLVFGLPAIAFTMQSALVREIPFGRAYSAVVMAAVYLGLASVLRRRAALRALMEASLALGTVFLVLAVPFAFDGHSTAAAWALEGAGLVWIGLRQQRVLARSAGVALLVGAGVAFMVMATSSVSTIAVLNSRFLGSIAIAAGSLLGARLFGSAPGITRNWEKPHEIALLVWGLLWWGGAALAEVDRFVPGPMELSSLVLAITASGVLFGVIATRLVWRSLGHAVFAVLPILWLWVLGAFAEQGDEGPLVNLGWAAWPFALAVSYGLLRTFEDLWIAPVSRTAHTGTAWLVWFLVTWTAAAAVAGLVPETPTWGQITWPVVTAALLLGLLKARRRVGWPIARHEALYDVVVPLLPAGFLVAWTVWSCTRDGNPAPLPYVPLLNPLEIAQGCAMAALSVWRAQEGVAAEAHAPLRAARDAALAALAFLALNAVVARIVHFYFDVPFDLESLAESASFQAGISVLWALTALSLMTLASRRATRLLWMTGAALLGLLVVKLFLADLSQVGAVARIVSFLVTGVLILIIGYVAPAPPKEQAGP